MIFNSEILKRFFQGKYSRKDYFQVKSYFENPGNRIDLRNHLSNEWMAQNENLMDEDTNIDRVLYNIHHQIRVEERLNNKTRFLAIFRRVAAVLIVPLILSFFAVFYFQYRNANQNTGFAEIVCPMGVRTSFTLPDGSSGFLNSGTKLKYPLNFKKERNVFINGEAYFDVFHNKKLPFTVHTQNLKVQVLGTRFTVNAYKNELNEKVVLNEGSVEVMTVNDKLLTTLSPNEMLILNTKKMTFRKENAIAEDYSSWTQGKLVFRNETMKDVATRLSRWYNVEIVIKDPEVLKYAFRATIVNENLEDVLKLLTLTAPIKFTEEKRELSINNINKKRKIWLDLDEKRLSSFN